MPYVSVAELRALRPLGEGKFSDDALSAAIAWFEETFEDYTRRAWEPRVKTVRLDGTGQCSLMLPDIDIRSVSAVSVYSAPATSVAFTAGELADLVSTAWGELSRFSLGVFPCGRQNISVTYSYGATAPPADVKAAALDAIRLKVLDDYQGSRQLSVQTEQGIVRTSFPGEDRPFGIPSVDAVANRRRSRSLFVA